MQIICNCKRLFWLILFHQSLWCRQLKRCVQARCRGRGVLRKALLWSSPPAEWAILHRSSPAAKPGSTPSSWRTTCAPLATLPSQDVYRNKNSRTWTFCCYLIIRVEGAWHVFIHCKNLPLAKLPWEHGLFCKPKLLRCHLHHLAR